MTASRAVTAQALNTSQTFTCSCTGGAVASVGLAMGARHPVDPGKPLIDYLTALMLTPVLLLGVSIGEIRTLQSPRLDFGCAADCRKSLPRSPATGWPMPDETVARSCACHGAGKRPSGCLMAIMGTN